ncbi:hypothetical protein B0I35DRAFT_478651 [Stachybotrys elegans]|uniref:Uncharacterized protein n=1 Tax=Stachybotrys elegans TaxID=80388 RepID=A0A8K0WQH1_9HYPO|nr:hypothetical protein B0I35DRAFT_478651 [Stachybotrys elegans]
MSSKLLSTETTLAIPDKATLSPIEKYSSNYSTPSSIRSADPFNTDIEAVATTNSRDICMSKTTTTNGPCHDKSDLMVWPTRKHWAQRDKAAKIKRSCTCMAQLSPRNRMLAKIGIVLLVVGIAVSVGFGISKPLGAPIWGDNNS